MRLDNWIENDDIEIKRVSIGRLNKVFFSFCLFYFMVMVMEIKLQKKINLFKVF